jgi:hypothetical protein
MIVLEPAYEVEWTQHDAHNCHLAQDSVSHERDLLCIDERPMPGA